MDKKQKQVIFGLMWDLAEEVARLKENECQNSGIIWAKKFSNELTKANKELSKIKK
jgi:hypothetical protein